MKGNVKKCPTDIQPNVFILEFANENKIEKIALLNFEI